MKNSRIYIIGIIALGIGLGIGYFLFGGHEDHVHENKQDSSIEAVSAIWTCSMHPQIRNSEAGECPICGMDLIPAETSISSNSNSLQMTEEAVKISNIQTSIVSSGNISTGGELKLNGSIQADETKTASLVTHIPGRIEKLYVSFTGEQVSEGQKIATIYSPDLISAQKELLEAQKIADISPGLLSAARNKLRFWKIPEDIIEGILKSDNIQETFDIYAEHSGVVNERRVKVGDYLMEGEVLFDVQDLSNVWAIFDVYESDLSKIKMGGRIRFTTPSVPGRTFVSKVTFINPVIDQQKRVANIRAEVSNISSKLKPDMFITGTLSMIKKAGRLTIPKSAVLWTGERSVVYIKLANQEVPSFEYREVQLGEAVNEGYIIVNGLEEGDEVVTNGAFVIDASAQLNNQSSMMNKYVKLKSNSKSIESLDYSSETPSEFKEQLTALIYSYLTLKDDLVDSNAENAQLSSEAFLENLKAVDMTLLKGEVHNYWMEVLGGIESHAGQISEIAEIESQRKQFDFLSQLIIKAVKVFGVESATFYVQHCPMANNDEGADWLSNEKQILNPYFGEKMLTCGLVQDTIEGN